MSALIIAGTAFAQVPGAVRDPSDVTAPADSTADAAAPADSAQDEKEVVITGTNVRGIAPPGTNVVSMDAGDIQATGSTNTAQILAEFTQVSGFNAIQAPGANGTIQPVNRPNLRGLPGFNTAGGSTTLTLMDGHRIVGMGTSTTTPDPDVIPPGALQRVDVVPDGGSSTYGSDAVAGVINLITRSRFDGVEVNGRAGFADDYYTVDGNLTVGTQWGSGGIFATYGFAQHDAIYGRDRDYMVQLPGTNGLTSLNCTPGNVTVGGQNFALPYADNGGTPGSTNQCDNTDFNIITPSQTRHSVLVGLSQDFSDSIKLDVKGFYFNRKQTTDGGPFTSTQTIADATQSPFYSDFNPVGFPAGSHSVAFAFGPDDALGQEVNLHAWGITPTMTFDVGSNWQIRALGSYGESKLTSHTRGLPNVSGVNGLVNAIRAGRFNPYDPDSSDSDVVAALSNFESFASGKQRLFNARIIADGSLITLPGGDVKVAVGAEYLKTWFAARNGSTIPGFEDTTTTPIVTTNAANVIAGVPGDPVTLIPAIAPIPTKSASQNVKSVFGEIIIPVFGRDNGVPGMEELTLSASGRYDDYNSFGGTFNPKFGATYKPFTWMSFRGAWGTSFNAPSPADSQAIQGKSVSIVNAQGFPFVPTGPNAPAIQQDQQVILILGGRDGNEPQEATTYSVGTDIQPPFLEGLNLSGTYWNIHLKKQLGMPPFFNANFFDQFTSLYVLTPNVTSEQVAAAIDGATTLTGTVPTDPADVYLILDGRRQNLGDYKVNGLDFSANYRSKTGFGSIDAGLSATVVLSAKRSGGGGAPFVDDQFGFPQFRASATLGANIGDFRAQATLRHTEGYDRNATANNPDTHNDAFDVVDLFFKYDVNGEGVFHDLSLTLNVANVFDAEPPINNTGGVSTLGRFVQFGISKKFAGF